MTRTFKFATLALLLGASAQPVAAQQATQVAANNGDDEGRAATTKAARTGTMVAEATHPPVRFELPRDDGSAFTGMTWDLGAAFATEFQALRHENDAQAVLGADGGNLNALENIGGGFNLGAANLVLRAELAPGMNLEVTTYLSSRHHPEAWIKDGFLMIARSPIDAVVLNRIMEYLSIKVGHFEVNYGDAHFRRTDNGHAVANPFVENLILDAFATEIGGEVYGRVGPILGLVGITNGLIRGDVTNPEERDLAFLAKLGVEYTFGDMATARLTGSTYTNDNAGRATLFGGDRAGSRYFNVMDNAAAKSFTNGRINPNFTEVISTYQVNPFVKFGSAELFGVMEWAEGRSAQETEDRAVEQYAIDAVYRMLDGRLYLGGRYNTVSGELFTAGSEQSLDRTVVSAGWFLTQYVLMKAEYVTQKYNDFPDTSIQSGGRFNGLVLQAAVAF